MTKRSALAGAGLVALLAGGAAGAASAPNPSAVVVSVGGMKITAADVSRRLAGLPAYQLAALGQTPEQVRQRFVERVLVPELLHAQEAARQKLDRTPAMRERTRDLLQRALETELRDALVQKKAVSDADLRSYFEANRARFETPRRIRIWRIAVKDEAQAKRILTESTGPDAVKNWSRLARDQSLDKATNQRDGDLGFVREDGSTDVPQVRVAPELFAAADKVEDGELVAEPIREGEFWAVVWRRGTMPAVLRTFEEEREAIRETLLRQKLEQAVQALAAELTTKSVRSVHHELLDYVSVNAFGDVAERERPGILRRRHARSTPEKGDRGYR
jgi:peptidyl-prolyl cis-trans isomerase C